MFVVVPEAAQTGECFAPDARQAARYLSRHALPAAGAAIDVVHRHGLVAAGPVGRTLAGACRRPRSRCVVRHLLVMGLALSAGAMLLGWSADRLRRRGVGRESFYAVIAIAFHRRADDAHPAVAGADLHPMDDHRRRRCRHRAELRHPARNTFPREMSARANAALNILHLGGAFALQYLTGVIVSWWPAVSGHPPADAYQAAFGFSVVLQLVALLWFLCSARRATVPTFLATRRPTRYTLALGAARPGAPHSYTRAGSGNRPPRCVGSGAGRALAADRRQLGSPMREPCNVGCAQRPLGCRGARGGSAFERCRPRRPRARTLAPKLLVVSVTYAGGRVTP